MSLTLRLIDLEPSWLTTSDQPGRILGVMFICPHCINTHVGGFFANPPDGGPPAPPEHEPKPRWHRTGDTFETLTLTPSIDAKGHWHGFVTEGLVTDAGGRGEGRAPLGGAKAFRGRPR